MSRLPLPSRAVGALLALSVVLAACAALPHGNEAPPAASAAPGYLFLSPNTDDHLSLPEALQRLHSQAQRDSQRLAGDILRAVGIRGAEVHDAVGDWSDGVENSLFVVLSLPADADTLRCAAAWFGLAARQKGVLAFHPDPQGMDVLTILDLPEPDLTAVRRLLDRHGIRDRTILPRPGGSRVVVVDFARQRAEALQQLAHHCRGRLTRQMGRAEPMAESTRRQAQQRYTAVIRAYQVSRPLPPLARLGR